MTEISRRSFLAGTAAAGGLLMGGAKAASAAVPSEFPKSWDLEADVVVIGAGAVGMTAAIGARDAGLSVLVVDANYDIGGHAICSGGNMPIGGGTALQKKYGIADTPEIYFRDLTDWSVNEVSGIPEYRYNDRAVQWCLAQNGAKTYDFLVANGVECVDKAPDNFGAHATGLSFPREHHTPNKIPQCAENPAGMPGYSLMRPLEASARKKGVRFLLNYHMDELFREKNGTGRVVGLKAHYSPKINPETGEKIPSFRSEGNIEKSAKSLTVYAKKAMVVATGGNSGNVDFRRMFDPRLTAEVRNAAAEYSLQDGSGEIAAMAVGASLWGCANQTMDRNGALRKRPIIGTLYSYCRWTPATPIWPLIKVTGLQVKNWQDVIIVNQTGRRFYNESQHGYPNGTASGFYKDGKPYVHGDWRNTTRAGFKPMNYIDAALAINEGSQAPDFAAGPQWAIFDSEAMKRERWSTKRTPVDPELFFEADTLEELAEKISGSPHSTWKMDGKVLKETVERYNSFVDKGADEDFDRPAPKFRIEKPPFYAAWDTFVTHDSYAGLRINAKCEVQDMKGQVIPGLYCGGESAGGCSQHGLARCLIQGYVIGQQIASLK